MLLFTFKMDYLTSFGQVLAFTQQLAFTSLLVVLNLLAASLIW